MILAAVKGLAYVHDIFNLSNKEEEFQEPGNYIFHTYHGTGDHGAIQISTAQSYKKI